VGVGALGVGEVAGAAGAAGAAAAAGDAVAAGVSAAEGVGDAVAAGVGVGDALVSSASEVASLAESKTTKAPERLSKRIFLRQYSIVRIVLWPAVSWLRPNGTGSLFFRKASRTSGIYHTGSARVSASLVPRGNT
jgi:hypothetical protein